MKFATVTDRLASLAAEKWAVHIEGKRRKEKGEDLIFLSIGEPDLPPPETILETARQQIRPGRLSYSPGEGEHNLLESLSRHYTKQTGRAITTKQFLFLPGTQTALYVAFQAILDDGDEVLLLDPYYATYEAVIAAPGGVPVAVPLDPDRGFHPDVEALARAITPRTRAILLNSPSNPTGAVFNAEEIRAISALAKQHDLWIVSDEVYASQVHGNHVFVSPFFDKAMEERTIVVSSISKSHAVPGFRCGWIVASEEFCARTLPVSETMLFGCQPFLQDALAFALDGTFPETLAMKQSYYQRGKVLVEGLKSCPRIKTRLPEGGMFVMLDVRATGLSGEAFARRLLAEQGVVTMPGESFGQSAKGHVRIAMTVDETQIAEAARRISVMVAGIN